MAKKSKNEETDPAVSNQENLNSNESELRPGQQLERKGLRPNFLARFKSWYVSHKKLSIPATVVLLLVFLALLPWTRYALAGLVVQKNLTLHIVDVDTNSPVSGASVQAGSTGAVTDGSGRATLKLKAGPQTIKISKKYYQDTQAKLTVPVIGEKTVTDVKLQATGRQVNVVVSDLISKEALADVEIKVADVTAKTDKNGVALLVLPAGSSTVPGTLKLEGYNDTAAEVEISDQEIKENKLTLTPVGKNYFFSNRGGKIDLYSSNLDGSSQEVVLPGTGNENSDISLSISPDRKWAAFASTRDGQRNSKGQLQQSLFVINLGDKKLVEADEGASTFNIEGWSGNKVIYTVFKEDLNYDNNERSKLKSYDVSAKKLSTLAVSNYVFVYATTGDYIVYSRNNYSENTQLYRANTQKTGDSKITADDIKYVGNVFQNAPDLFIIQGYTDNSQVWYKYTLSNNKIEKLGGEPGDKVVRRMILSSDGKNVVWVEDRDGQGTLLVADNQGQNQRTIATRKSLYYPLQWVGDNYVIFRTTDPDNADYIVALSGGEPVKIADVFRQNYGFGEYY